MSNKINGLAKKYVLWPEIENDYQKNIDFSKATMKEYRATISPLIEQEESIESRVALFYLVNEELSKVRERSEGVFSKEDIQLYKIYTKSLDKISKEIFAYLLVACLVEARHTSSVSEIEEVWGEFENPNVKWKDNLSFVQNYKRIKSDPEFKKVMSNNFKPFREYYKDDKKFEKYIDFIVECEFKLLEYFNDAYDRDEGYDLIADQFLKKDIGHFTIGETLDYLENIFTMDHFDSGYGGEAWAKIAQHAKNFANGKMNAEMFIDQAFSLEHNNGNIFNKDFLFKQNESEGFSYYDMEDEDTNSSTIKPLSLLLTAQHLGCLKGLLTFNENIENIDEIISEANSEAMDFETEEDEDSSIEPQILNNKIVQYLKSRKEFSHLEFQDIQNYIDQIPEFVEQFDYTLSQLNKQLKDLLSDIEPTYDFKMPKVPLDIKKLFREVSCTLEEGDDDDNFYSLQAATEEGGNNYFFDIVNYFNNEKFQKTDSFEIEHNTAFSVYHVNEISQDNKDKNIIGGKAWSLVNMTNLNLPVPKAQVFTTDCCKLFYDQHDLYKKELAKTLPSFNDYLKDSDGHSILCSVRSGAPVSMPGMMDTVLNVGIDDSNYQYFCKKLGKKVTNDCATKFMELFCSSRLNKKIKFKGNIEKKLNQFKEILSFHGIDYNKNSIFPLNTERQIEESLYAVFNSWNSERAKAYRIEKNISDSLGTAAIVQQMVFGNLNDHSCTGVVFSRNCVTGTSELVGEFLPKAQGEDVVSGSVTPFPIDKFKAFNKEAYEQLAQIAKKLETQTGQIQDIEFTVEDGKLYILQHRQAICSPMAALKLLKENNISSEHLLEQVNTDLIQPTYKVSSNENHTFQGLSANPGVLNGIVIKKESDMKKYVRKYNEHKEKDSNFGWIFYAPLTSPEHMPIMNKTDAFITEQGGFTSHAAIISRSLNKPCIVGIGDCNLKAGQIVTIDAKAGKIWEKKQDIVYDDSLVKSAVTVVLQSQNVKLEEVKEIDSKNVTQLNKKASWMKKFPEAVYVQNTPVKLTKFLDIGQKVAMFLIAERKEKKEASVLKCK